VNLVSRGRARGDWGTRKIQVLLCGGRRAKLSVRETYGFSAENDWIAREVVVMAK